MVLVLIATNARISQGISQGITEVNDMLWGTCGFAFTKPGLPWGLTQVKGGRASKQPWCCGAAACSAAMRACVAHVHYMGVASPLKLSVNAARVAALPLRQSNLHVQGMHP